MVQASEYSNSIFWYFLDSKGKNPLDLKEGSKYEVRIMVVRDSSLE